MRPLKIRPATKPEPEETDDVPTFRVLIVDDLPEMARVFHRLMRRLRGVHVHVTTEVNGTRALERVKAERFDLVVSDLLMPGMDGFSLLARVREENPVARRVLMTGYDTIPSTSEAIRDAEVDAYLRKPFDYHGLTRVLTGLLVEDETVLAEAREDARRREATELELEGDASRAQSGS